MPLVLAVRLERAVLGVGVRREKRYARSLVLFWGEGAGVDALCCFSCAVVVVAASPIAMSMTKKV